MAGEGLRGVDVSQHQGSVQWERVHGDGFRFAIVKSSEGQDFIDRPTATRVLRTM
jgi:lysozyme